MKGIKEKIKLDNAPGFTKDDQGILWYEERICVPDQKELKDLIMGEAHESRYLIHPGGTKVYQDLKKNFWWKGMKSDVAAFIASCDTYQRVKAEHQKPAGLLQPIQVPEWKWDEVGMDFITGLPKTRKGNDSIWVIVDRLTKKWPTSYLSRRPITVPS